MEKTRVLMMTMSISIFLLSSSVFSDIGKASYYNPPYVHSNIATITHNSICVASACNGYRNDGLWVGGASEKIWKNGSACGKFYQVRCILHSIDDHKASNYPNPCQDAFVVVQLVDYCPPPGCRGTINLSRDAFSLIADLNAGIIDVDYFEYQPGSD